MQTLTSLKNPAILAAKALQTKAGRESAGLFLCDGEHLAGEAIQAAPGKVRMIFVEDSQLTRYAALVACAPGAEVYRVPSHVLSALSQVKTPQGIVAVVETPKRARPGALGARIVLLENVQDPGNVGTILRTADAAGFTGCILTPGCADPFSPKALRATMGSVFRVPLSEVPSAGDAGRALATGGYAVVAAALSGDDFYARKSLPEKLCLMIGNEGAGLTDEAIAAATHRYRLPMQGGAESLNAAIAAAIMMYDFVNRG